MQNIPFWVCRPTAWAAWTIVTLLAACGGGDGDPAPTAPTVPPTTPTAPTTPTTPALQTWQGKVVIDQGIEKAIVCVDLNSNAACGSGEPTSSATDSSGSYRIQYQPTDAAAATQAQQAPLIAQIDTNAVDAQDPASTVTQKAFTLHAPAGKAAQINPLTTLVQRNIQRGASDVATAEQSVALQLGITVADIYDYQSAPSSTSATLADNARTAAKVTAFALEIGSELRTPLASDAAESNQQLGRLRYVSVNEYRVFVRSSDGVPNADGYTTSYELRTGKAGGVDLTAAQLYTASPTTNSMYLTDKGWNACNGEPPRLSTRGLPARTSYCDGSILYYGFSLPAEDVSGQAMADVLTRMQTGHTVLNTTHGIPYAATIDITPSVVGNATFSAGARLITAVSVQLNQPLFINNTAGDMLNAPTLEALIAARPSTGVVLSTAAGTIGGLGMYSATEQIRSAFVDSNTIALYRCEVDMPSVTNPRNCNALPNSSFSIATRGGSRYIQIDNVPGTGQLRGYAEYNGSVYVYRQERPFTSEASALSYSQRLNGTAWENLCTTLAIAP